jgi:hypothetical protein
MLWACCVIEPVPPNPQDYATLKTGLLVRVTYTLVDAMSWVEGQLLATLAGDATIPRTTRPISGSSMAIPANFDFMASAQAAKWKTS